MPHGFLGRRGGVSGGLYASLNVGLGSDDDRAAVIENRRRAMDAVLPGARLVSVHQVHSAEVVTARVPWPDDARPHADGVVTDQPGLLLGILTADCVPVLFADVERGVVGAAHAGWKGALAGVTDNVITAMVALGARRDSVLAAIGPCIGRAAYEVSDDFAKIFEAADSANERFFTGGRAGHHYFDIEAYVIHRLSAAGIDRIDPLGIDTYGNRSHFFSYRRTCHAQERDYGRQISLIGIAPKADD
ncbi:MAG: peptidoglycan editing factor PgeF [Pseudomonadota bacterium]